MKRQHTILLLLCILFCSCEKDKAQTNYLTDISIEKNNLNCDGIIMKNYTGVINKAEFLYGEEITLYYENMRGFALQDSLAYPEMDIIVLNKKGDTVFSQKDLLKDTTEGYTEENLNLTSNLTFALPMLPRKSYEMNINIRDKYNDETLYKLKKDFKIIENPLLDTKVDGLTYDILYLFSETRKITLLDSAINPNEKVYILLENLEGYEVDENGKVDLFGSIVLTQADGTLINANDNLFPEPVSATDLKEQVYASFSIYPGEISNPVTCNFEIIDNKTKRSFKTSFEVMVQQ